MVPNLPTANYSIPRSLALVHTLPLSALPKVPNSLFNNYGVVLTIML
jgi:hypothetical protein